MRPYPESPPSRKIQGILAAAMSIVENGKHGPVFEVAVRCAFHASHQLPTPDGWEPLHEHEWHIAASYVGCELGPAGLLLDFGVIQAALERIVGPWRGQNLNRLAAFAALPPSAENLARYVAEQLATGLCPAGGNEIEGPPAQPRLYCVEVEEAPGCVAKYYPAGRTA
jgi:6-pyruvoyltetrahydropterin/6-carboxytetrahydropterin synthase